MTWWDYIFWSGAGFAILLGLFSYVCLAAREITGAFWCMMVGGAFGIAAAIFALATFYIDWILL